MLDKQLCKVFNRRKITLLDILLPFIVIVLVLYMTVDIVQHIIEDPFGSFKKLSIPLGLGMLIIADFITIARCPKNK